MRFLKLETDYCMMVKECDRIYYNQSVFSLKNENGITIFDFPVKFTQAQCTKIVEDLEADFIGRLEKAVEAELTPKDNRSNDHGH